MKAGYDVKSETETYGRTLILFPKTPILSGRMTSHSGFAFSPAALAVDISQLLVKVFRIILDLNKMPLTSMDKYCKTLRVLSHD